SLARPRRADAAVLAAARGSRDVAPRAALLRGLRAGAAGAAAHDPAAGHDRPLVARTGHRDGAAGRHDQTGCAGQRPPRPGGGARVAPRPARDRRPTGLRRGDGTVHRLVARFVGSAYWPTIPVIGALSRRLDTDPAN